MLNSYVKWVLFPAVAILFFTSCKSKQTTSEGGQGDGHETIKQERITSDMNNFAFDLFMAVNNEKETNLIISPFSISTAMAMTYAGARNNTADQMAEVLHFHPRQDIFHASFSRWMNQIRKKGKEKEKLQIANSLWPQTGYHFLEEYFRLIETFYNAALHEVDYTGDREAIRQQINQWVLDHTNDLIEELIKPGVLVEDTRLVLVNAIYFLSQWKIAFDENATHTGRFFTSPGNSKEVSLMYMKDTIKYAETNDFQMIELPYEDDNFSMVVLLPSEGNDLETLAKNLNADTFQNIISTSESREVEVYLPSFKARSTFDLEQTFAEMGMPLAFTNMADFSGMTGEKDLKIDKIIHQAYIDVKEEGTEAAASTAVVIIRKSAAVGDQPTIFRADRPFLYFIKENTHQSIIFMGKTGDPSLSGD